MNNKMIYTDTYHLTQGDFDRFLRIKPYAVFNFFQESAAMHANLLNFGFDEMLKNKNAWILLRNRYTILKPPSISQKVHIETWPLPSNRIEYNREFRILDSDNSLMIKGTSKWGIIDIETGRLTRNGVEFPGEFYRETNYENDLSKIPNYEFSENNLIYVHQIKPSELDRYQHMNNAKYSDIILNAINPKKQEVIRDVKINFINDAKLEDCLKIYCAKEDSNYFIAGKNEEKLFFKALVSISAE